MAQGKAGTRGTCSVDDCDQIHLARGLCTKHYQRLRKHGTLENKRSYRESPRVVDRSQWSPENIAWLAGIIEGEGTITLPTPNGSGPRLVVAMTDQDVIDRVRRIAGCGLVNRYEPPSDRQQTQWHWKLHRQAHIDVVLRQILPWLSKRRTRRVREVLAVLK